MGNSQKNDTSIDDSVETNLLDTFLETLVGRDFLRPWELTSKRKYLWTSSVGYPCYLFSDSSVSKFWKRLISDPYFNMKHQRHHKNDLNSQKLLVTVHMVTFFSSSSLSTVQLVEDVQNLDCPTNCIPDHYCNIYGSCNGLVLVDIYNRYDKQLLLWNPSTRESTILPHRDFISSDDYKILKLGSYDFEQPFSYEILALKSGSWRKIRNYPSRICPNKGYTLEIEPKFDEDHKMEPLSFLNGALHWVGFSGN
ncbi:hypothetical protein KY290_000288 [Solanum tuberosum]|uniref:F-box associated beta-propeller type 3 domain-containing protein n=1 Tax=Solanum tuberosum TaxID=4113 RepID=A0ABQ7WL36_SOLTU|nr:hypothetical protein KY290_000288 [Solanum tuberosum]